MPYLCSQLQSNLIRLHLQFATVGALEHQLKVSSKWNDLRTIGPHEALGECLKPTGNEKITEEGLFKLGIVKSHLCKLVLSPPSQQGHGVCGTHGPYGCQQKKRQEVHNVRQAGLLCLVGVTGGDTAKGEEDKVCKRDREEWGCRSILIFLICLSKRFSCKQVYRFEQPI